MSGIQKMQIYQQEKEDEFSENQNKNSGKIVYYTCVQIAFVLIIGIFQIFAFRSAFKAIA